MFRFVIIFLVLLISSITHIASRYAHSVLKITLSLFFSRLECIIVRTIIFKKNVSEMTEDDIAKTVRQIYLGIYRHLRYLLIINELAEASRLFLQESSINRTFVY